MTRRIEIGARSRIGFGASISAPGQDVASPNARLLFSTEVRLAQILFEATIEATVRTSSSSTPPPNVPGVPPGSGTITYYAEGYGRFVFPRVLPFKPYCAMNVLTTDETGTTYRFGNTRYAPQTDSVEIFYVYVGTSKRTFSRIALRVGVYNIPVDR